MEKMVLCLDEISNKMEYLSRMYLSDGYELIFTSLDKVQEHDIKRADALVTFTYGIPNEIISKADNCKLIQKLGAGVNNIDLDYAAKRNIQVANTTGFNATSVAEHTVMLMLSVYKHVVKAHTGITKGNKWFKTSLRDRSFQLTNKKVGLIGLGNIGKEVLRMLKGFNCELFYYDIARLSEMEESELKIKHLEINELVSEVDVLSLHIPLTEQTYHLINKTILNKMKTNAIIINTCRGGVINEDELYEVLIEGHLTGAGLDVFENEPIDQNHKLASLSNVVLTPHIGGGTVEAMEAVIIDAYTNINEMFRDGYIHKQGSIVNFEQIERHYQSSK